MLSRLRKTFESAADGYDAGATDYPEQLFDDLVELAALRPRARLLEIGCATGKATRPLLERGYSVLCVELGVRLAECARANFAGMPIEVHVAPFEVWEKERDHFDLVYQARGRDGCGRSRGGCLLGADGSRHGGDGEEEPGEGGSPPAHQPSSRCRRRPTASRIAATGGVQAATSSGIWPRPPSDSAKSLRK